MRHTILCATQCCLRRHHRVSPTSVRGGTCRGAPGRRRTPREWVESAGRALAEVPLDEAGRPDLEVAHTRPDRVPGEQLHPRPDANQVRLGGPPRRCGSATRARRRSPPARRRTCRPGRRRATVGGAVAVPTSTSRPSRKASRSTPAQEPVTPVYTTPAQPGAVQPMRPAAVSAARLAPIRYTPAPPTLSTCGWLCPTAVASGPRAEAGAAPPARGAAVAGTGGGHRDERSERQRGGGAEDRGTVHDALLR